MQEGGRLSGKVNAIELGLKMQPHPAVHVQIHPFIQPCSQAEALQGYTIVRLQSQSAPLGLQALAFYHKVVHQ